MASKRNRHEEHAARARLQMFEAKQELEVIKQVRRSRDNRFALLISIIVLVVVVGLQSVYFEFGPGKTSTLASNSATPSAQYVQPAASLAENKTWTTDIHLNSKSLVTEIYGNKAPQAASNFLYLAKKGFYKNTSCHRLTTAGVFILQCGDPNGDGTGGPGYNFGPIENAPPLRTVINSGKTQQVGLYPAGTIAMARRSNDPKSQGSQFFIVYKDSYFPNDSAGGYSVFGKITSGLDTLMSAIKRGVEGTGTDGKPKAKFIIRSVVLQDIPAGLKSSTKATPKKSR